MPRRLRIEFHGARYHVMNRGDRREAIFRSDHDRELFLECLAEVCRKADWKIHAYCLMPNHFHLALETPQPNLVAGMKWFLGVYTTRFNARHRLRGHLFSGRYKALIINPGDASYLRVVCQYIHLNPSRAKLLRSDEPLEPFGWSSYPAYLGQPRKRPGWLRTDLLFGELGIGEDTAGARERLRKHMEQWRLEEDRSGYGPIRRGWFLGDKEAGQEFLRRYLPSQGRNGSGGIWKEAAEAEAEEMVRKELAVKEWTEPRLKQEKKGHPFKTALAKKLREQTTMTLPWIAKRLKMGTASYVYALLLGKKSMQKR